MAHPRAGARFRPGDTFRQRYDTNCVPFADRMDGECSVSAGIGPWIARHLLPPGAAAGLVPTVIGAAPRLVGRCRWPLLPGEHVALQHIHRFGQLRIVAFRRVIGRRLDDEVRLNGLPFISTPRVVYTPVRGSIRMDPSMRRTLYVKMTWPPVGWPTTFARLRLRSAFGNTSASAVGPFVNQHDERLGPFAVELANDEAFAAIALLE